MIRCLLIIEFIFFFSLFSCKNENLEIPVKSNGAVDTTTWMIPLLFDRTGNLLNADQLNLLDAADVYSLNTMFSEKYPVESYIAILYYQFPVDEKRDFINFDKDFVEEDNYLRPEFFGIYKSKEDVNKLISWENLANYSNIENISKRLRFNPLFIRSTLKGSVSEFFSKSNKAFSQKLYGTMSKYTKCQVSGAATFSCSGLDQYNYFIFEFEGEDLVPTINSPVQIINSNLEKKFFTVSKEVINNLALKTSTTVDPEQAIIFGVVRDNLGKPMAGVTVKMKTNSSVVFNYPNQNLDAFTGIESTGTDGLFIAYNFQVVSDSEPVQLIAIKENIPVATEKNFLKKGTLSFFELNANGSDIEIKNASLKEQNVVHFKQDIVPIFSKYCGNMSFCHSKPRDTLAKSKINLLYMGSDYFSYADLNTEIKKYSDLNNPGNSKILKIPLLGLNSSHPGGSVFFDKEDDNYRVIKSWLIANAPNN